MILYRKHFATKSCGVFFICKQELLDRLCCILYNIINPIIGDDTVNNTEITTSAVAAWRAAVCAVLAIVLMIIAQLAALFIGLKLELWEILKCGMINMFV